MVRKYIWLFPLLLGLYICAYSVIAVPNKIKEEKTYIETTATVTGHYRCLLDDGTYGENYVAEYEVDGNKYEIRDENCVDFAKAIDEKVKIKYNPNNPSVAIFANDYSNYFIPFIGIIFVLSGIYIKKKINI